MTVDDHIKAAAKIAQQLIYLPMVQLGHLRAAREAGLSYEAISRALTIELVALKLTPKQIEATGTGPSNIRKRLKDA